MGTTTQHNMICPVLYEYAFDMNEFDKMLWAFTVS